MKKKTVGFSGKMIATVVAACGAQIVALVVSLVATGNFSRTELAQVVSVVLTAVFGFVAGYAQEPDVVATKKG